ncbi:MAG: hypothetical protein K0M40_14155 [Prolixibacteraceae bacterium]|nr:hypothetical protein [Prolixibacteraceae bacterium]
MYKDDLVHELIRSAKSYGLANFGVSYIHPLENTNSSIIFNELEYSFQPKSWQATQANPVYSLRTKKIHSNTVTSGIYEMQSSNSSDALAMNIFCFPDFAKWNGVKNLFGVDTFSSIQFGFNPQVAKNGSSDSTEVDVFINKSIICECKLTEEGFTQKEKQNVEQYDNFKKVFHADKLIQNGNTYLNYQLIRNILAAYQHKCHFVLICDMRRPDLVKSFYQTIRCIKDDFIDLRTNCEIIYWQDIAKACGAELQQFLKEKYGIY